MSTLLFKNEADRANSWSTAFKVFGWLGIIASIIVLICWTIDDAKFTDFLEAVFSTIAIFATSSLFRAIHAIMEQIGESTQKDESTNSAD